MSISGGNIVVELSLDDKNFTLNVKNAGTVLRQLQGTLGQTAASVKRLEESQLSLGRRFRDMVLTLGNLRFVAMDVNDVFLRLPLAIAKTAGELERTQALLSGLSKELTKAGKAAEAASNFDFITRMAMRAPFEIGALSDAFVKLKSAGLDPAKGSLQALVDGVAKFGGNSESLKRASVAIQQMLGKGVVSMEELRQQLGEAVPTAMQSMAEGMGLSMNKLTSLVSKGTVEASSAINKMLVVMQFRSEDAAGEMMKTWTGMVAQLKTRLELAAKEIADAGFGQALKDVGAELGTALNSVEFRRFNDAFGRGLGDAVRSLADFARVLVQHADMIKMAAAAWATYKVASSLVTPAIAGTLSGLNAQYDAIRRSVTAVNDTATAERTASIL
jgi:tape measure domain-containing protein